MTTINIGDNVRVTDPGNQYTTFDTWADDKGLKSWVSGRSVTYGVYGRVVAKAPHSSHDNVMLYGIEDSRGKQYIIGERGLEFCSRADRPTEPVAKAFSMADFKPGMRVVLRNGSLGVVSLNGRGDMAITLSGGWLDLYLKDEGEWDVVEVFAAPDHWEALNINVKGKRLWKTPDVIAEAAAQRARLQVELAEARAKVASVLAAIAVL